MEVGRGSYYWCWITWEETSDPRTVFCTPPPLEEMRHFRLVYLFLGNSPLLYFKANITSSSHARQHSKGKILSRPKYDCQFLHEATSPMSRSDSSCFWCALYLRQSLLPNNHKYCLFSQLLLYNDTWQMNKFLYNSRCLYIIKGRGFAVCRNSLFQ